ncbi:MAG: type IV toxin-antitoxin system AbiEi family antitoxin domain-containing protein [Betaproteobacteria bacterium]|nr:type IV toxin-antitoxin system AbiEi family antitoxin domain-containing protein [Betaproteobacteria bacterium]
MPRHQPPPTQEQSVLRLARTRGLLQTRDVVASGIPTIALTRLVRNGQLVRAGRGVYVLPGQQGSAHRSLAEVALRAPRGVVCLLSALSYHEIGTQAPFEVWLALPAGVAAPRLASPAIRVVRMSGASLTQGVQHVEIDGVEVPVFDPAKTVADCFKFRNKIGLDVALEALREAWHERKVRADALWSYAKLNRVANVMRPYLEALM